MARLTKEERAALQRQLDEDAALDDDFEVEIEDGGKRARVPYSKGKSWLQEHFGIDLPPMDPDAADDGDEPAKGGKKPPADDGKVRRFGRTVAG